MQQFRRRCLQAALEGASLEQLSERAPQLLLQAPAGGGTGGISIHALLDQMGRRVGQQLQQQQASLEALAAMLLSTWQSAYCYCLPASSSSMAPAVAVHLLSIAHSHPALHAPLLGRLRRLLLAGEQPGEAAMQLEAAVVLATFAGVLQPRQQAGSDGAAQVAARHSAAGLQPIFVWRQPARDELSTDAAGAPEAAPAEVPGPMWLHQLLLELPLGSAGALARASRIAAAHLGCLRHFRRWCLLPHSSSVAPGALPVLQWCQAAPAPVAGYNGEFAASLVLPACTAALRLQQWLLLRLSVARRLLPDSSGWGSGGGGSRPAKRPRAEGQQEAEGSEADAVLRACGASLASPLGAPLAAAAGESGLTVDGGIWLQMCVGLLSLSPCTLA